MFWLNPCLCPYTRAVLPCTYFYEGSPLVFVSRNKGTEMLSPRSADNFTHAYKWYVQPYIIKSNKGRNRKKKTCIKKKHSITDLKKRTIIIRGEGEKKIDITNDYWTRRAGCKQGSSSWDVPGDGVQARTGPLASYWYSWCNEQIRCFTYQRRPKWGGGVGKSGRVNRRFWHFEIRWRLAVASSTRPLWRKIEYKKDDK